MRTDTLASSNSNTVTVVVFPVRTHMKRRKQIARMKDLVAGVVEAKSFRPKRD